MRKILNALSKGSVFRTAFMVIIGLLALVTAIGGLYIFIVTWGQVDDARGWGVLGIILFQFFFIFAIYAVVHILILRAWDVYLLPDAEFTVIPIVSMLIKLFGELFAVILTIFSIAAGILIWMVGSGGLRYIQRNLGMGDFLHPLFGGGSFLYGVGVILGGILYAFVVLILTYFIAETIVVMVSIARNTARTRVIAEKYIDLAESDRPAVEPVVVKAAPVETAGSDAEDSPGDEEKKKDS